jgi:hypothetical protein
MFELPTTVSTISVSALRDYHRCGYYYRLKRIEKLPSEKSHHMAAGSAIHEAFYLAYGVPIELVDNGRFLKPRWEVLPGRFEPGQALQLFRLLWWRSGEAEDDVDRTVYDAYMLLKDVVDVPTNFKTGQKKALKADNQEDLRKAWYGHYHDMLEASLAKPFEHPVIEIERKIEYQIGSHQAVGYIDLVLQDASDKGEIYIDLKSSYNRPSDVDLMFDEQMNCYYQTGPKDIWYFHLRSNEVIGVDPNFQLMQWYGAVADQTVQLIEAGVFPKRFSSDCVSCEFRTRCIGV